MEFKMNKININYCYLNEFSPNKKFLPEDFKNAHYWKERKIGELKYIDPDSASKRLYDDLRTVFSKTLPNGKLFDLGEIVYNGYYQFKSHRTLQRLSSDFLGPSATGAFDLNVSSLDVGKSLTLSRTIGGHTLWPCHRFSINQAKASVNDRMDITLLELKDFYENPVSIKAIYSLKLREAFVRDKEWLMQFESFIGFCDFFMFKNSFVNKNYDVIMFEDIYEHNRFRPKDYLNFMKNNVEAIRCRNEELKNFLDSI